MNNKKDMLFDDMFDYTADTLTQMKQYIGSKRVRVNEKLSAIQNMRMVRGDVRLSKGMYRDAKAQERYKKESLERHLP